RRRLGASSVFVGLPGPTFEPLLPSHLPRRITTTSDTDSGTPGAAALVKTLRTICCTALPLLMSLPGAVWAQDAAPPSGETTDFIGFSADQLIYDDNAETVTASGEVRLNREGYHLRADRVIWDRISGEVRAEGNVRVDSPEGDVAYGDSLLLENSRRGGIVEILLLVLEDGGRLAAVEARREGGLTTLTRAAYTPCAVIDENGCPRNPIWQISAVWGVHDPV